MVDPPDAPHFLDQLDLPTARKLGGFFTATWRLVVAPQAEQIDLLKEHMAVIKGGEGLTLVRSAADIEGVGRQVLHAEGIYFIETEKDLDFLDWLWEEGFRSLGPLYNEDNALGGGGKGDPGRGFTPLGRDLALRAWAKGFLIDSAHMNHKTLEDLIDLALATGNTVHYTHGHLDAPLRPELGQRGIPRELVRKLFETGGLLGLKPHPGFLGTFERHLEEIDFLAEIAPDQVVLGSDFCGMTVPRPDGVRVFEECKGIWGVPGFAERLARIHGEDFARGYFGDSLKALLKRTLP